MSGQRTRTDVLVAGGGLVGLTAALLLRAHDIPVTLVEKRASASPQPKARRLHMRSMEIFRELGLAGLVHDAARDLAGHDHMAAGKTLAEAAQLPLWEATAPGEPAAEPSPELPCLLSQDLLEPLLRQAAADAGADVRFDTELVSISQSHDSVDAHLLARRTDRRCGLTARYLIAADGARSPLREMLGITRSGNGACSRGSPGCRSPTVTARVACSSPGTRRTSCLRSRPAGPTPGSPTPITSPGSSPRSSAARPATPSSTATTPSAGPPAGSTTRFEPRGRIGTRVPHRWLDQERTRSTIDLAGPQWATLDGTDFLGHDELVLLRPDHIIAWRGTDPAHARTAQHAILNP
jgi:FAD binding domain